MEQVKVAAFINSSIATSKASFIAWDWAEYAKNVKFKWDIVPVPAGKAGNISPAAYLPIGIGKTTKHPEEAYKLLQFLTTGKGQDIQAKIISAVPTVKRNADQISSMANAPENAK